MRLVSAIGAAALGLLLSAAAPAQTPTRLIAVVGPEFEISLTDANGNRVRQLDPGTYTIDVDDRSDIHNFHLSGPGVNEATTVEFVGRTRWTVTFREGRYRYICDPHPDSMNGSFVAGNPPPEPPPAAPRRINATVAAGGAISVTATVRTPGRFRVVVRDRSRTANFHLVGPGVNRKTGARFRGTVTWSVHLRAGTYRFFNDRQPRLRSSITIR